MADASHLERMGRELNCPICLSLLNSAVSLSCNHVFCDKCIEKSMKSSSSCPVCKVPYRRREIRPAPHMDNLVSVYRSMEVALGVNIFVTQTTVSTNIAAEDNQAGANNRMIKDKGKPQSETSDCKIQKLRPIKMLKRPVMANKRNFGSTLEKPSFPAKKRIQVPLYSTTEMQRQPGMQEVGISEIGKNIPKGHPPTETCISLACEKGDPVFTPFFWLQEDEDNEKSSQQTSEDPVMCTPFDVPSFSDIKDSDDEREFFDSEMFDSTRKPDFPELCLSPAILQIEDNKEHTGCQESAKDGSMNAAPGSRITAKKRKDLEKTKGSGKVIQNERETFNKRVTNATETRERKRNKETMREADATYVELKKAKDESMLRSCNVGRSLDTREAPSENEKVVCSDAIVQPKAAKKVSTLLNETESMPKRNKTALEKLSASKHQQQNNLLTKSNKIGKTSGRLKNSQVSTPNVEESKNDIDECQNKEVLVSSTYAKLSQFGDESEVAEGSMPSKISVENCNKELKSSKKVKFSESLSNNNYIINPKSPYEGVVIRGRSFKKNYCPTDQPEIDVLPEIAKELPTLNRTPLRKCKVLSDKIHCSFCQSSEESEASGTLVKYYNGKLVTNTQTASSMIVHVHKNCTEWAPNVYFEGDNVVNLEAELSRCRRIKCCCCGIKGAALGCYEKNCRKSFHVPCARLTPECRWDYENYVMLCPLHASHQLPNQEPGSHTKPRRNIDAKSQNSAHQPNTTYKCESSTIVPWKIERRHRSLVLCCSAISNVEKGIVSEFQKKSGVTVLKNWGQSVTHVIASTDENGACRRTLKVLMGVLEGKWILSIEWIKACMNTEDFVEEQQYEIAFDIHGIRNGPRLGRLRLLNKQPKLFDGCNFYFMGDFTPSYKGYLRDLIVAAGGKVLNRKPVVGDHSIPPKCSTGTYILYSQELAGNCKSSERNTILNRRRADAEALASSTGAIAASNSWMLDSIAGHKLQTVGL